MDSNVFIYVLDRHPRFGKVARGILERIENGEEAVTSTLAIQEVCIYLLKRGRPQEVPEFVEALRTYGYLLKRPCLFEDIITAKEMMRTYRIGWNDLVMVAQMQREGITEIYSNDADFDPIPGIKRIFS